MKRFILSIIIIFIGALSFSCKKAPIKDELWEAYSDTLKQFQHETFKVMSSQLPEDSQLLAKYRDYNLAYIEEQKMKFYYLLEHHPERIMRNQRLVNFVNFKWTNEDREALHKSVLESAELEKRILSLWREIETDWAQLKERMETVYKSDEYKEMQRQHGNHLREYEEMLKK